MRWLCGTCNNSTLTCQSKMLVSKIDDIFSQYSVIMLILSTKLWVICLYVCVFWIKLVNFISKKGNVGFFVYTLEKICAPKHESVSSGDIFLEAYSANDRKTRPHQRQHNWSWTTQMRCIYTLQQRAACTCTHIYLLYIYVMLTGIRKLLLVFCGFDLCKGTSWHCSSCWKQLC